MMGAGADELGLIAVGLERAPEIHLRAVHDHLSCFFTVFSTEDEPQKDPFRHVALDVRGNVIPPLSVDYGKRRLAPPDNSLWNTRS